MRKRTGSLQISPRRLLSLLLIHILVVFAVSAITGVSSSPGFVKALDTFKGRLTGGNSFVRTYRLISGCNDRFVRMNPSKKPDAEDIDINDPFAQIIFKSVPGENRAIQILGEATGRYLCFSRRGRPVIRYNGRSKRCRFHEIPYHGYIKLKSVVKDWYLGFNKNGRRMKGYGNRSRRRQKCYLFTKIPVSASPIHPHRHQGPFKNLKLNIGKR